jgi:hypothetical protein
MMSLMKRTQTETSTTKRRGYRFWLIRVAIFLGLPVLLYYGYCWGLWGRHSLLLQYLFQCSCPPASEEARYPDEVDVIISDCRNGRSILSPSGRLLAVYETEPANASPYLLDLQTGEKIPLLLPEKSEVHFLTDNLLYTSLSYDEKYILDRTTGNQYPLRRYLSVYPGTYLGGDADPNLLAEALRQAKYVFFIRDNGNIVALDPDFPASAEKNFLIDWLDFPVKVSSQVEQFLKEYNVAYQAIPKSYPEEVISPDGRFVARPDGIYLIETNQLIVKAPPSLVMGWASGGRGAIYSSARGRCLIRTGLPFSDDVGCATWVPQPVIILNVPEEYLLP